MKNKALLLGFVVFVLTIFNSVLPNLASADLGQAIGTIDPPPGVDVQNTDFMTNGGGVEGEEEIAIFFFFGKFLQVLNVVAGIWVLVNLTLASFTYISSQGEAKAHQTVRDKLTMSVAGLALLVIAYLAAAILGLLFFGDAGFILKPTLPEL